MNNYIMNFPHRKLAEPKTEEEKSEGKSKSKTVAAEEKKAPGGLSTIELLGLILGIATIGTSALAFVYTIYSFIHYQMSKK